MASSHSNGIIEPDLDLVPSTPTDVTMASPIVQPSTLNHLSSSSQQSMPSTADPASPLDPSASFQTELNDDHLSPPQVIRSSLSPPPSSQVIHNNVASSTPLSYANSQRLNSTLSPPTTATHILSRDLPSIAEYVPPPADRIDNATVDELRAMLQASLTMNAKLKSETTHHNLQYELLSIQAREDANRANVEHEMTRREVEALRSAEHVRQARRDLETRVDPIQLKYRELQQAHDALTKEHNDLQAENLETLNDDRQMLVNRIRENRQHFHMLCSPGGVFYGALTPKTPSTSPQQHRTTPRQTPRSATRGARHENESNVAGFAALLQALNQDNSAPTTPISAKRPTPRVPFRQHRAAHSMSSLPATPLSRSRGNPGLLPSLDLVPQTEPAQRYGNRVGPQTPTPRKRRKSRESTISAEDEDEDEKQRNARTMMTLESVAAAAQSYMSNGSRVSQRRVGEEEEVFESQASQAASEMLRRDPRESFEVASSVGSRDVTPIPTEKPNKLQTKLYAPVHKAGLNMDKRKFSGGSNTEEVRREVLTSPPKKMRHTSPQAAAMATIPRGLKAVLTKSPTDVVILSSLRTPICRSYKGKLKDAYPEELLSAVLRATLAAHPALPPSLIADVAVGVVLSELGGSKAARMALNHAGFPNATALHTVNRACASSLQSIAGAAAQIRAGACDVAVAAGMESMTRNYGSRAVPADVWPALRASPNRHARDCLMPMGLTSENVAARYGVSRASQDAFAVASHARAARAQAAGFFDGEIVPVTTRFVSPATVDARGKAVGEEVVEREITVTADDGIRAGATLEGLAKLKPAFAADGRSTAGNSSQVSDGAAATLLMRRGTATALGLSGSVMGRFVGAAVVGCDPDEMGVGPAVAVPALLGRFGLGVEDVQRWELNEAFASQAIYCLRALGLEGAWERGEVNPDGGAIALGHPLGATGARLTATLLHGLGRSGGEVGVVTMCVGTGMGMAGLFVRE
ncbi:Thiolase, N-terminal domain-containing protein [Hypoxylon argillaceum]|nr:Thiolase, N-terminal domain-containing protein [Hypoxylon argillaceum]